MDDTEKQISELRAAALNLINAAAKTNKKFELLTSEIKEIKAAQAQIEERLDKIENLLDGRNGNFENIQ